MGALKIIGIFLVCITVLAFIGLITNAIYADYQYSRVIGSYIDNAANQNTPTAMLEQLTQARAAMVEQGLQPDMYGAIWFKQPSNSMKFQYQHLDSLISRVKSVEIWYQDTYESNSTLQKESLGDVYDQKMANLATFINAEPKSDYVAHNLWLIQHNILAYTTVAIWVFLLMVVMFFAGLLCVNLDSD